MAATSASRAAATRSSSAMWAAFSGTASVMNSSVGVSRSPVRRPTSERRIPFALSRAAADAAFSSSSPNTV